MESAPSSTAATSTANKRNSALPRFGATKLPGLKSPTASTGIPAPRPSSIARAPPPSSWNAAGVEQPGPSSISHPRVRNGPTRLSNGQNNAVSRPMSRQAGTAIRPPSTSFSSGDESAPSIYGVRRGSTQETEHTRNISSEGSEEGSASTGPSAAGDISPVRKLRPRPSLSDRTIESLSRVPPSPGDDRRRTSMFGPNSPSPTTPRRPVSQMSGSYTANKPSAGTARPTSLARPASPTKRPVTSYGGVTPARKVPAPGVPKPASSSMALPRTPAATTMARRSSIVYPGQAVSRATSSIATARQNRPQSTIVAPRPRPASPTKGRPMSPAKPRPQSLSKPALRVAPATVAPPVVEPVEAVEPTANAVAEPMVQPEDEEQSAEGIANCVPDSAQQQAPSPASSTALRQQIAQARAAAKAAKEKEAQARAALNAGGYNFEDVEDPFNQKPKDGKDLLRKRIDDGRRDGRLNIAAMALKAIPDEVMKMYDAEAMESSSVSWSECVDLVRLNAADNDLTEIDDKIFPDRAVEELSADGHGNQLGGLEHLDLHGNRLMRLPPGIRHLGRLTLLNLSRNNLDNIAVDLIAQMPTLKELNLAHNSLSEELPESLCRLTSLEVLDLSFNRLNSLPKTMKELIYLKALHVSNNRLTSIPFDQLAVLPKLCEVTASANALTGALFPSSVQNMPTLKTLDVSDNAVASFNFAKVLNLPSIVRLDVSRNRIGTFPDVSQWQELTTLVADENALSAFPRGLTSLTSRLRIASLERNSLREVDEAVAEMHALEQLNLAGNPIRERKLLGMDTSQVKEEMLRKRQLAHDLANK